MAFYYLDETEIYKCKQHPSKRHRTGICPTCLKLRLSLLCPNCATLRPCPCTLSCTTTTTSSYSSASTSSSSHHFSGTRMSTLIDIEPPFQRSRSSPFSFLRRSSSVTLNHRNYHENKECRRKSSWSVFWFKKHTGNEMVTRSKSVSTENGNGKANKGWYFPSPMKVFKYSKTVNFFYQRSPLHRG